MYTIFLKILKNILCTYNYFFKTMCYVYTFFKITFLKIIFYESIHFTKKYVASVLCFFQVTHFWQFCTNLVRRGSLCQNLVIFVKMVKIVRNVNVRAVSFFHKSTQNSQKTFSVKCDQFSTSGNMLCTSHHFCALHLFLDDL